MTPGALQVIYPVAAATGLRPLPGLTGRKGPHRALFSTNTSSLVVCRRALSTLSCHEIGAQVLCGP